MARSPTMLGLVVLRLLAEGPMHPYEMRQHISEQGIDHLVKVTHGALYHAAESLTKAGLIEQVETEHEKRGPERTEYAITDTGRHELLDRLWALTATPGSDYPSFRVALAFLCVLSDQEAEQLLRHRAAPGG